MEDMVGRTVTAQIEDVRGAVSLVLDEKFVIAVDNNRVTTVADLQAEIADSKNAADIRAQKAADALVAVGALPEPPA